MVGQACGTMFWWRVGGTGGLAFHSAALGTNGPLFIQMALGVGNIGYDRPVSVLH